MPQTPNSKSPKASSGAAKNARPAKATSTQAQSSVKKKTATASKKATASKRKAPTKKSITAKTASVKTTSSRASKSPKKAPTTTSKSRTSAKEQNEKLSWVANVRANLESHGEDVKKFNIRLIDIAHKDTDQFFDMSRAVVRARSWPEVMEIQAQYVSDRINCYHADAPIDENPKSSVNVFAWIARQAGAALNSRGAPQNG